MTFIATEFESENHVRQWIRELTSYPPHKIDKVLEQIKKHREVVHASQPHTSYM